MKKISSKIIIAITVCSLVTSVLIGTISIVQSSKFLKKEATDNLINLSRTYSNDFSKSLKIMESLVESLSAQCYATFDLQRSYENPDYIGEYRDMLDPVIKRIAETTDGIQGVYISFNPELSGQVYDSWYADVNGEGNFTLQESEDISAFNPTNEEMEWYYRPIKERMGIWSEPYIDNNINVNMISYSKAIFKSNTLIGVIGIDVSFKDIKRTIEDLKIYETGYAFLLTDEYDVVIHKQIISGENFRTVNNGELRVVTEHMERNESGFVEYKFKDEDKITGYSHLSNGWILAVAPPLNEIFKPINNLKNLLILISFMGVLISYMIAFFVGKKISKPVLGVTELINKTADLDLTDDSAYDSLFKYKDETGIMVNAVTSTRKVLRAMVNQIADTSNQTLDHVQKIVSATMHSSSSIEEVSEAIEQLAQGASEQARQSELGTERLLSLAGQINHLLESSNLLKEYANKANTVSQQGIEVINELQNKFESNNEINKEVSKDIDSLANKSSFIGGIVNTIQSISKQTNLLALNAAIEAARAGEYGRGFSVVAEEIRKLAEQSSQSTMEIGSLIEEIQSEIDKIKNNMDISKEIGEHANIVLFETSNAFKEIVESVIQTINKIDQLLINTQKVNQDKDGVVTSIQEISAISEESAASTEEVSASLDEQVKTVETLAKMSEELKLVATSLQGEIQKFKI
ncbi:MAG: methyl-accepting chemotaxis protein [Halanaerobiales bacterium]|nr:methyl-accepting chemotaxis protein [Halanaerobiales bacterium]